MANAKANGTINGVDFTNFKKEIQTLNYAELNFLISDIMLEIKKRSYNEGMVKAMTSGLSAEEVAPKEITKTPQQLRDEIVEKAKRDITELKCKYNCDYVFNTVGVNAEYIINKTKRAVVCLLRGYVYSNRIYSRGIAKCDPSDCFNVHIGKAIALRRALGLEVPAEYLTAPHPTEVRVGDVVEYRWLDRENPDIEISKVIAIEDDRAWYDDGQFDYLTSINKVDTDSHSILVIDDSRANNEAGVTE
jgi:hypothetical protein